MLAAAPKSPARATTFCLALTLLAERKEAPQTLVFHFNEILDQAKILMSHQAAGELDFLPEAADVAFEATINSSLMEDFRGITDYNKISPHMAAQLLEKMNRNCINI